MHIGYRIKISLLVIKIAYQLLAFDHLQHRKYIVDHHRYFFSIAGKGRLAAEDYYRVASKGSRNK